MWERIFGDKRTPYVGVLFDVWSLIEWLDDLIRGQEVFSVLSPWAQGLVGGIGSTLIVGWLVVQVANRRRSKQDAMKVEVLRMMYALREIIPESPRIGVKLSPPTLDVLHRSRILRKKLHKLELSPDHAGIEDPTGTWTRKWSLYLDGIIPFVEEYGFVVAIRKTREDKLDGTFEDVFKYYEVSE